jgi:hypothetical protein
MTKVKDKKGELHAIESQTGARIPHWSVEAMGWVVITYDEAATRRANQGNRKSQTNNIYVQSVTVCTYRTCTPHPPSTGVRTRYPEYSECVVSIATAIRHS